MVQDPALLFYRLPGSIPRKRRWARLIMARFGSLERFIREFNPEEEGDFAAIHSALTTAIPGEEETLARWREQYKLKVLGEEGYPKPLLELSEPPIFLFFRGSPDALLSGEPRVVIVGTRNPTPYGARMTQEFAGELASLGASIGSGLARGVDGIAHQACLKKGGKTWAVLAHGCDEIYPPEHRPLAEEIVACGGVLISEYPPGTHVATYQFPERNRILAALASGVVVIEGTHKSGSLITAEWALELGREIFALPGRVGDPMAEGPLKLLKSGAHLALSGEEILSALGWTTPRKIRLPQTLELPSPEKEIWEALSPVEPMHVDLISARLGIPVNHLLSRLFDMELKGYVEGLPGKLYLRSTPPRSSPV